MSLTNTTEQFWDGLQNDDNDDVCGTLYLDLSTLTAPEYIPESLMGFAKDFNRSTPVSNTHV